MHHELHAANTHRAEFEAANVQNVEGDLVTLADFAEKVFHRRLDIGKDQGVVLEPLIPILCSSAPDVSPGCFSTMKALNLSPSTLAKTTKISAKPPLVIHIFSPLMT